jgi:hypothetical protein
VSLEKVKTKSDFLFLIPIRPGPPTRPDPLGSTAVHAHGTHLVVATTVFPQSSIALPRACASPRETRPRRISPSHSRAPIRCPTHVPTCAWLLTLTHPLMCACPLPPLPWPRHAVGQSPLCAPNFPVDKPLLHNIHRPTARIPS